MSSLAKQDMDKDAVTIRCATNATYTNMKVMLNEGDHALPYQPYEGPVTHDGSLAAVAKSGEYSDLKDKPALFSGVYFAVTPPVRLAVFCRAVYDIQQP
jgi:hypothetical protein